MAQPVTRSATRRVADEPRAADQRRGRAGGNGHGDGVGVRDAGPGPASPRAGDISPAPWHTFTRPSPVWPAARLPILMRDDQSGHLDRPRWGSAAVGAPAGAGWSGARPAVGNR